MGKMKLEEYLRGQSILVVARHFPPVNSGGSRRSALIVEALEMAGATVCVVSPLAPLEASKDFSSTSQQKTDRTFIIVKHPQPEPAECVNAKRSITRRMLASFKSILRLTLGIPDPDIRWARRSTKAILRSKQTFDWVVTTSPPESVHFVGYFLKKHTDVKWLVDFRDFWLVNPLFAPRKIPTRAALERLIARKWIGQADRMIAVSAPILTEVSTFGRRDGIVLEQFTRQNIGNIKIELDPGFIHVGHTGAFSLSDPDRKLIDCLDLIAEAMQENSKLRLHLAGRLTTNERATLNSHPMAHKVIYHGLLDMNTSQAFQRKMHALLVCSAPDSMVVPGKYYEYLRTGRPIIGMGGEALTALTGSDPVSRLAELTIKKISLNPKGMSVTEAAVVLGDIMKTN